MKRYGSEKEAIPILSPEQSQGLEFWITNKIREIHETRGVAIVLAVVVPGIATAQVVPGAHTFQVHTGTLLPGTELLRDTAAVRAASARALRSRPGPSRPARGNLPAPAASPGRRPEPPHRAAYRPGSPGWRGTICSSVPTHVYPPKVRCTSHGMIRARQSAGLEYKR